MEMWEAKEETQILGFALALPSLSNAKHPSIRLCSVPFAVSLAFHLSRFLPPVDYAISLAFPLFCSFYSVIGSFAVDRKDEKQKVLTTRASKIMC